jgi:hypothetical protein
MTGSESAFVAIGAVGFLLLVIALVLGEFADHGVELGHADLGHAELGHADLGHAVDLFDNRAGLHQPSPLSFRVIAASAVGFGAFGYVAAHAGWPPLLSWPVAVAGFVAVGAGTFYGVLRPLARQQYNSVMSRWNYVGQDAVVTLDILPGGSGQVSFRDRQGARVTQTARTDVPDGVAKGARVTITDLTDGGVVVHRSVFSD